MARLPVRPLSRIVGPGAPLVLAPHPDDESLGCGGLIAACCARGLPPLVVVLTDGSRLASRLAQPSARAAGGAAPGGGAGGGCGARAAAAPAGVPGRRDGAAPAGGPAMARLAARVAALLRAHRLRVICTSWRHDPHCDHEAAHRIAAAAAARTGARLLAYPVWGWLRPGEDALPGAAPTGARLAMRRHLPAKRRAVRAHASQAGRIIRDDPAAFCLPAPLIAACTRPFEVFLCDA